MLEGGKFRQKELTVFRGVFSDIGWREGQILKERINSFQRSHFRSFLGGGKFGKKELTLFRGVSSDLAWEGENFERKNYQCSGASFQILLGRGKILKGKINKFQGRHFRPRLREVKF